MPAHTRISAQFLCAILIVSFLVLRTSRSQSNQSASLFHEEVLAEITPGAEVKQIVAGNHHLAWVEKQADKRTVLLDSKQQGGAYDDVTHLIFSPDESHFAFFGKQSSKWSFVLDGQERSNGYSSTTSLAFQPEGTAMAYCQCREKKCRLVIDGSESGGEYEDISYPQYSRDGKRIAFLAKRSKKWLAVVDGKELGPELDQPWFSDWGFSRDGSHFFVSGRVKNSWLHAVDGTPTPGFDVISRVVFTRDGRHYAYGGADARGGMKKQKVVGTIVMDGQTVATYEGKGMPGTWTALGGEREVMLGGVRDLGTDFHGVSTPEFDPDGKLVYAARRDKGDVAVFRGQDSGPGFDEVLTPVVFTEDSSHFVYIARQGSDFVEVRDNKIVRTVPGGKRGASAVGFVALTKDSSHIAYETISGGHNYKVAATLRAFRTVIIDGQAGSEYNALRLVNFDFDPESRHYFYQVIGAEGDRSLVNIDGHESRLCDYVAGTRYLPDGKTIAFIARDGSRFLRFTYTLGPTTSIPPVSTAALIDSETPDSPHEAFLVAGLLP